MKGAIPVKVYYKDTDAEGVVYYASYLGWLEMGRMELVEALGVSQKKLRAESGIVFAVSEVNCKYLSPAFLGDRLEVATTISDVTGAKILFKQYITRPIDGKKVIDAQVTAFAMDLKRMAPGKIPKDLRDKFSA